MHPKPVAVIYLLERATTASDSFSWAEALTTIEQTLDGRLTTTKYKGATLRTKPMHVVVFSNDAPPTKVRKLLSLDRWFIHEMKPLVPGDTQKMEEFRRKMMAGGKPFEEPPAI